MALGSRVLKLVRTAIGPLRIGDLQIGKYRALAPDELRGIYAPQRRPGRRVALADARQGAKAVRR
jgi:16S rRNA U516 pseudouridylate synthase RsuA-like enzyme